MDDEGVEYDGRHYIGNLLDDDSASSVQPTKTEERSAQTNSGTTHRLYDEADPFVAHQPTPSSFLTFGSPIGPSPNQKFWPEPPPPYSPPLNHHAPFLQNYFIRTPLNAVKPTAPSSQQHHPTTLKSCSSMSAMVHQRKSPQLRKDTATTEALAKVEKKAAAELPSRPTKTKTMAQAVKSARVLQPAPRIPGLNPIEPVKAPQNSAAKVVGAKQKEPEHAVSGWKSNATGQKKKAVRSSSAEEMVVQAGKAGRIRTSDPQSKGGLVKGGDEMIKNDTDPTSAEGRFSVLKSAPAQQPSKPGANSQQKEERRRNGSADGKAEAPQRLNPSGGRQDAKVASQQKSVSKGSNKKAVARRQQTGSTYLRSDLAQLFLAIAIWIGEALAMIITPVANSASSVLAPTAASIGMLLKVSWKRGWKWWNRSLLSGPNHTRRKVTLRPNQHHIPRKRRD